MKEMNSCTKYMSCSVPICPLDEDWRKRTMSNEEGVCFFMNESVKPGAKARFINHDEQEMWAIVSGPVGKAIQEKHSRIKSLLERAKVNGSRWDAIDAAGQRLHKGDKHEA